MTATIVNVRSGEPYDLYIGRSMTNMGLHNAGWGNPYRLRWDGTRAQVIAKYEDYIRNRPDLLARLPELRGKRLGCWCAPAGGLVTWQGEMVCHGQVLLKLLAELDGAP